jgi:hypothetical protein
LEFSADWTASHLEGEMSIESRTDETLLTGAGSDEPGGVEHASAKEMAGAAKEQTAAVAGSAVEATKDVAHQAATQASVVAGEAKEQIGHLVDQAKTEFKTQADARGQQAAAGLQTVADQLTALTEGRSADAGQIGALAHDAQRRISGYAQALQQRGPQAVLEDITSFARRRPATFLVAAGVVGFAVGRLVRAGAAVAHDNNNDPDPDPAPGSGSGYGVAGRPALSSVVDR